MRFTLMLFVFTLPHWAYGQTDRPDIFASYQQEYCEDSEAKRPGALFPQGTDPGTIQEAKKVCRASHNFDELRKNLVAVRADCITKKTPTVSKVNPLEKITEECGTGRDYLDMKIDPFYKGGKSALCNCAAAPAAKPVKDGPATR